MQNNDGKTTLQWLLEASQVGRTHTGWPQEPSPVMDWPHKR